MCGHCQVYPTLAELPTRTYIASKEIVNVRGIVFTLELGKVIQISDQL
jgi:hypothetical protein